MFYYHNQLLPPMFLNLFLTSSQVHDYGTRTASRYRLHSCRTYLKQFTILYQGPKIWNSLPISVTSSPSFLIFKKKNVGVFLYKIMNWPSRTYRSTTFSIILTMTAEVASLLNLVVLMDFLLSHESPVV